MKEGQLRSIFAIEAALQLPTSLSRSAVGARKSEYAETRHWHMPDYRDSKRRHCRHSNVLIRFREPAGHSFCKYVYQYILSVSARG